VLNDSLLDNVEQDRCEEVIGDMGSSKLQYCKRVKFLEKAWILVAKDSKFYWVEQDKIPIDRLQRIKVADIEESNENLQLKLKELTQEKNKLADLIKAKSGVPADLSILSQTMKRNLENENRELNEDN
jgi:predicted DNA-binding ArsR family transcriptional regulator